MTNKVPLPALLLGLAGLIPPVGLTVVPWLLTRNLGWHAGRLLEIYAALILSFLGGAWWAFACREEQPSFGLLAIAVVPSLAAWAAVSLLLPLEALLALTLLLLAALVVDAALVRRALAPGWWMGLRIPLSTGLALCCGLSAFALSR
ncbi:hypothetical protein GCM10022281_16790 [Sphingomonas rosea]|uniref:DUF3429 domain-containing protein n=1 Tax=Sphingomonas rosea TaxID=335605 RepID=A0ABP7U6B0_9SPHN